jgi:hypothetical protein
LQLIEGEWVCLSERRRNPHLKASPKKLRRRFALPQHSKTGWIIRYLGKAGDAKGRIIVFNAPFVDY